jgi:hypothetical protein
MARTVSVWGDAGHGAGGNGASANGGGPASANGGRPERRRNGTDPDAVGYLRSVPDLASPIRRRSASFTHVASAYLYGRDGRGPDGEQIPEEEMQLCREHFPELLEAYEEHHGHICRSFYGQHAFAAAAITKKDELEIVWSREESRRNPAEVRLLSRCDQLSYAAYHRLHRYDRRHCQQMIFSVVLELLRRIDQPEHGGRNLTELSEQLDDAEDFMLRSATRRTQSHYLKGMLGGTGAVLAIIGVIAWVLAEAGLAGTENADVVLALSAGATGALVSVLMRMTVGEFSMNLPTLDGEMRQTDVHLVAAVRPLIGAVSGVIAYALVRSSLVPLEPPNADDPTFLWMGVAFLAGFSERLAQDMFARSGRGLSGPTGEAPTSGPSAGLSQAGIATRGAGG